MIKLIKKEHNNSLYTYQYYDNLPSFHLAKYNIVDVRFNHTNDYSYIISTINDITEGEFIEFKKRSYLNDLYTKIKN